MEWLVEFKKTVTNSIGRICPQAFSENFFKSKDKIELWSLFLDSSKHLEHFDLTSRLKLLEAGHVECLGTCYCGKPIAIMNRQVSKYCSKGCMLSAKERCENISKVKKSQDHTAANQKRNATMLNKYGVAFNSQRPDIHHIWKQTSVDPRILDRDWLQKEYVDCKRSAVDIADQVGCYYSTVLFYCKEYGFKIRKRTNYSLQEKHLSDWLTDIGVDHSMGDYDVIAPYEIDCLIESSKVGVEINGLYWHSKKSPEFHKTKTDKAASAGYSLFHFTDEELALKTEICKGMILSKIGLNQRLFARLLKVKNVSSKEARLFLDTNHIQGFTTAKYTHGLYMGDELMMLGSFGSPRFNKNYDWEVIRVSTKIGFTVVGGLSKIISAFKKENTGSIMSYVDRKYGNGNSFTNIGFELVHTTDPGYSWTDGTTEISRFKAQKKQLVKWLPSFDPDKTEKENMESAGYRRIWDCGQLLFALEA